MELETGPPPLSSSHGFISPCTGIERLLGIYVAGECLRFLCIHRGGDCRRRSVHGYNWMQKNNDQCRGINGRGDPYNMMAAVATVTRDYSCALPRGERGSRHRHPINSANKLLVSLIEESWRDRYFVRLCP